MAKFLRVLGILFAVVFTIAGIAGSATTSNDSLGLAAILGGVLIICCTLITYTVVMAQAQMIAAVLDTAVNTSPLMELATKEAIIKSFDVS